MAGTADKAWGHADVSGYDESLQVIVCPEDIGGWIVLTRYKHRGTTDAAWHLTRDIEAAPLTLAFAERFIHGRR